MVHTQVVTDRVRCSVNIRCPQSKPKPIGTETVDVFGILVDPGTATVDVFGILVDPWVWLHSPSKPDVSLVPSAIDQEIAIDRPPRVPRGTPALWR